MDANHILIPVHDFNAGGTEETAFRLASAWIAAGRKVTLLAGASNGRMHDRVPGGANVVILSPEHPRSTVSRLRLGSLMAKTAAALQPDVIFIPGNYHLVLGRALKQILPGVPIVGKISNPLTRRDGFLMRIALRWWTRGIDLLVAMSTGLENDARCLLPWQSTITVQDPFLLDDVIAVASRPAMVSDQPLRLLALGRLEPQKNFALAIDCLKEVLEHREATLTIVGEGQQGRKLAAHIARNGMQSHVILAGYVPDINIFIDEADVLIISSRYEGGPVVAVEALLRGVPFVSTACSHLLREMVGSDPTLGTIARNDDAAGLADAVLIQSALTPPTTSSVMKAVEQHRIGHASAQYLEVFDRLIAGRPPLAAL